MKIMLEIFFRDIPAIVFEPIAVLGWLGLIAAFVLFRKERTVFYLTVIFSLIFMILWRMAIQIVSSRYAEILIFPMSVAAGFFIFQLEYIRKIFPKYPEKYVKHLPWGVLAAVTVICIGKNLNCNTFTPIMESGRLVREDKTPGKRAVYVMNFDRANQVEYYSGEKARWLTPFKEVSPRILTPELCRSVVEQASAQHGAETVYIFAIASRGEPVITEKALAEKVASWELFAEKRFNRKGKRLLRVYKCTLKRGK